MEKNDGDQPGAQNDEKRDRPAPGRQLPYSQLSSGEAGCIPKAEVLGCPFHWATHMWGSRRFLTGDDSRNNWGVALIRFGEGLAQ